MTTRRAATSRLARPGLAGRSIRWVAAFLIAAGAATFVAGAILVAGSLAPMWGLGSETSSVPAPSPRQVAVDSPAVEPTPGAQQTSIDRPVDGVAFTMRVPSLDYGAVVYEGVDSAVLARGPGHYPTTAWPGHAGTVGVAAHNVYWLSFSRLAPGDRIEIQTRRELIHYEITGSKVTDPRDVEVLAPTDRHLLVLTTCFPLWAGAYATQRLIFFAQEIGVRR